MSELKCKIELSEMGSERLIAFSEEVSCILVIVRGRQFYYTLIGNKRSFKVLRTKQIKKPTLHLPANRNAF